MLNMKETAKIEEKPRKIKGFDLDISKITFFQIAKIILMHFFGAATAMFYKKNEPQR